LEFDATTPAEERRGENEDAARLTFATGEIIVEESVGASAEKREKEKRRFCLRVVSSLILPARTHGAINGSSANFGATRMNRE